MAESGHFKKKYAINFRSQGKNQTSLKYSLGSSLSIYEVSIEPGAMVVTRHPFFWYPEDKLNTKIMIFPFHAYDSIEYDLVDIRDAIQAALEGTYDEEAEEWLSYRNITGTRSQWRFETKVLDEKVIFTKGYSEWLDMKVDEVFCIKEKK